MLSDPIADMLSRIRNGYLAHHRTIDVPYSKMKASIANLMNQEGYLANIEVEGDTPQTKTIKVTLKYDRKQPVLTHLKRISKQGLRVYRDKKNLQVPLNGYGTGIISTSKGLMTIAKAKQSGIGGEIICEIW